jgi:hypothetical protein
MNDIRPVQRDAATGLGDIRAGGFGAAAESRCSAGRGAVAGEAVALVDVC